jgi:hypothetical protein
VTTKIEFLANVLIWNQLLTKEEAEVINLGVKHLANTIGPQQEVAQSLLKEFKAPTCGGGCGGCGDGGCSEHEE